MTFSIFKPREDRRRVSLSVRLRMNRDWEDGRICNISTRGMMIASRAAPPRGTVIEVRRGQAVAIAWVVWSQSEHFGVRLQDAIRISDFIDAHPTIPRNADDCQVVERRAVPRPSADDTHADSRVQSSAIQFAGAISLALAGGCTALVIVANLLESVSEAIGSALL